MTRFDPATSTWENEKPITPELQQLGAVIERAILRAVGKLALLSIIVGVVIAIARFAIASFGGNP